MHPTSDINVMRSLRDTRMNSQRDAELRSYLRSEFVGGGMQVPDGNTRAGREMPASRRRNPVAWLARALARTAGAVGAAFGQPDGS